MNRRIFVDFLKDQLFFTLTYYGGASLVIVFYTLEIGEKLEYFYPILLVSFVYLLFICERAVRYWRYCHLLDSFQAGIGDRKPRVNALTNEQQRAFATISRLEKEALTKLNGLE
ncbi:MAG: hypothetical protein AB2401_11065, partial [Bacillus sp. (in: firmicutes)]